MMKSGDLILIVGKLTRIRQYKYCIRSPQRPTMGSIVLRETASACTSATKAINKPDIILRNLLIVVELLLKYVTENLNVGF